MRVVGPINPATSWSRVCGSNTWVAGSGCGAARRHPRLLLENATLQLQMGGSSSSADAGSRVYALTGPNGCGKSSLLRRLAAGKIPGFPPHRTTLYVATEQDDDLLIRSCSDDDNDMTTVTDWIMAQYRAYCQGTVREADRAHARQLEAELDALDLQADDPQQQERMEQLAEALANLEDELLIMAETPPPQEQEITTSCSSSKDLLLRTQVQQALDFMGLDHNLVGDCPVSQLTPGQRTKVRLAMALTACLSASCDLLLLDEPTSSLDVPGLLHLRDLVETLVSSRVQDDDDDNEDGGRLQQQQRQPTTIVLVSHDVDFINDVATDVVEFDTSSLTLRYYAGNYEDYRVQRAQEERCGERRAAVRDQKRRTMTQTLQNLRAQPVPKRRGGAKKKARQISSHKKKMDRILGSGGGREKMRKAAVVQQYHSRQKQQNTGDSTTANPTSRFSFNFGTVRASGTNLSSWQWTWVMDSTFQSRPRNNRRPYQPRQLLTTNHSSFPRRKGSCLIASTCASKRVEPTVFWVKTRAASRPC